jgi:DNA-directed RNA polymerase subunit RPC12/RpoP
MGILMHHLPKRFKCQTCNWSIIRPGYTGGDLLGPYEIIMGETVSTCPKCGSKDIKESLPISLHLLNPLLSTQWRAFVKNSSPDIFKESFFG